MPLVGAVINDRAVKWDDIPIEVMSPESVESYKNHERSGGFHVSDLTICPHKVSRQKLLDFYLPVETLYRMSRGNAWDAFYRLNPRPGADYQVKWTRSLNGVEIEGTADVVDHQRHTIEDVKAPGRMYYQVPQTYEVQLNAYHWLAYPTLDWTLEGLFLLANGPGGYRRIRVKDFDIYETKTMLSDRLERLIDRIEHDSVENCPDRDCFFCWKDEAIYEDLKVVAR